MRIHRVDVIATAARIAFITLACRSAVEAAQPLPWEREIPLKEAARTATITTTLDPLQPAEGVYGGGTTLSNFQVRSALWGPPNRVTLSLLKTDVWDRRYGLVPAVTLDDIRQGAYSPRNRGFDDMPPNQRRPVRGYLLPSGGRVDTAVAWNAYPFPCQKPVGQIIIGLDELAGVPGPQVTQSCADGVMRCRLEKDRSRADLQIVLAMTRNVFAIRGRLSGVKAPWLRLYRHEDQAFIRYMTPDRTRFRPRTPGAASGRIAAGEVTPNQIPFDYEKDAAWNGPVEPPKSGSDGRYFWIHQRFPGEKTFPRGFDYVLMGVVAGSGKTTIATVDGHKGLGTPPFGVRGDVAQRLEDGYETIRQASGSAATAHMTPDAHGRVTAYVTVVTGNDADDPMAEARRRLAEAVADGYDKLVAGNAAWYAGFYDRRENGRIFYGVEGIQATDNVQDIFRSWHVGHGGQTRPDMRRYEATASYANVEQDWQLWHSLPCYNEIFYTATLVRNRADAVDMWWKIIEHWRDAARANARDTYGVSDGLALVHGYLPPVKPDRYVHTSVALEYCLETIAQMVKVLWDEWDYGGDERFLRERAYPAIRDTAVFYANYATKGDDGYHHFVPSMEAEAWGIFPEFKRMKDAISVLSLARWAFLRAAEAAEHLGVDAGLRTSWLEMAVKMAPYPVYQAKEGTIFNSMGDTIPGWKQGDHPWYIGFYPTTLADEINLDSSKALRDQMIRTVEAIPARGREALALLGASRGVVDPAGGQGGRRFARSPESLLNSRSGRIHLFPNTLDDDVVAFRNFQARGGYLVSAARDEGGVTHVEIEARRDGTCRLMNPWRGVEPLVRETVSGAKVAFAVDTSNGECLVIPVRRGVRYRINHPGRRSDGPSRRKMLTRLQAADYSARSEAIGSVRAARRAGR